MSSPSSMAETLFELLAPAKDLACGLAAVECGADAVYIGAERFGARKAASNPRSDIAKLIARAHLFRAKVYAAVNTILRDEELEDARRLITELREDGIDGIIIQDFGILELDLPPVPLIASTQMHNNSPERVRFLQDAGFSRAILARELSLEGIQRIRAAAPDIELEFFVHGALCVSYSGRCYLSYALGGRSANRGECAQPCRKPYRVQDEAGKVVAEGIHALCLKDLNLSTELEALIGAGVTSFKIEGRLKDEAYVKNTVLWYRRAIDAALAEVGGKKASSGTVGSGFEPDLAKTFNRGYTTHFLKGSPTVHAHATPKFVGEPAGTVRRAHGGILALEGGAAWHPGDGLAFFDAQGCLRGTAVNKAAGDEIWVEDSAGLAPGTKVFRNNDRLWLKALATAKIERKMTVAMELRETKEGLELNLKDEDGIEGRWTIACAPAAPKDAQLARDTMARQLAKLGGTPFTAGTVTLAKRDIFVAVSVLNELRRNAVAALTQARVERYRLEERRRPSAGAQYPETSLTFEANVFNRLAEKFLREHGVKAISPALETRPVPKGTRVMVCKYCLRRALGLCEAGKPVGDLMLVGAEGVRLWLQFNCATCVMEVYV